MVVKFTIYGCGGTFSEQPLKQNFKHFNFFEVLVKFPWQQRTNIFRVDKIAKSVSRNKLMKNLFREKNYLNFFQNSERSFFAIDKKLPVWLSKLQSTYLFKVLRENIYFLKLNMISTVFGVWDQKTGSFSQKIFFRVQPTKIRASRAIFRGKSFLFPKCFFSVINFGVWLISLSFSKVV